MRIPKTILVAAWVVALLPGCQLMGGDSNDPSRDSDVSACADGGPEPDAVDLAEDGVSPGVETIPGDLQTPDTEDEPCIEVTPGSLHFGGKTPGTTTSQSLEIHSCGAAPLEVQEIALSADSLPAFGLDLGGLPATPSTEAPLVLEAGGALTVHVSYVEQCPDALFNEDGTPAGPGAVVIHSNAPSGETIIPIEIAGVPPMMPVAVIECQEGNEVVPGTVLHLVGDGSYVQCDEEASIAKYQWDVDQPEGSASKFIPSADFPNPSFDVGLAGVYTFYLTVYDENDTPCCFPATYEVVVVPDQAIWIELFWHIPGYSDEVEPETVWDGTPDLHLAHPLAEGPDVDGDGTIEPWFNTPYDCWWFNSSPDWGPPGPEGDPVCTPGAVTFLSPESLQYRFGVHYQDEGYGPAYATVRVYIFATLVLEMADVELHDCEVWEVGTVEWPSGKVTATVNGDGSPKVLNSSLWCFHGDGWQ
jgi:hypothetical protein